MALRFRKTLSIAPGLKLNIGKKSASIRAGGSNAGVTVGTAGKRTSVSLPGTGLGYTRRFGSAPEGSSIGRGLGAAVGVIAILIVIAYIF